MIVKEVWIDIHGYKGFYQVSTFGRVRSLDRYIPAETESGVRLMRGKVLKASRQSDEYPRVVLSRRGVVIDKRVHILVLEAFVGSCPAGMECRHLDGNPANNYLDNLCWGTPTQNQGDRAVHGTGNQGSRNYFAKVDESVVKAARRLALRGMSRRQIAATLKQSYTIVSDIVAGRTWRHVA